MPPSELRGWMDAWLELKAPNLRHAEAPPVDDPAAIELPADVLAAVTPKD